VIVSQDPVVELLREIRDLQSTQVKLISEIKSMNEEVAAKNERAIAQSSTQLQGTTAQLHAANMWNIAFVVLMAGLVGLLVYYLFIR
jgi:hypothetical protein